MFPTEPVPEKIGAYKVIRRLAGTGAADVYLGRMDGPMGFQRLCALKLVANSIEDDVRLAEELAREASICARLNHPAVVRMFDFFEYDRRLVLVLEHVDGVDLDRLTQHLARRRQKLGDDAIWYMAHQLVGALAHAHAATDEGGDAAPVIHRNVQPENILLSWDGQVRLTGFGLGKILGRSPDTIVGMVKGTPGFMAPEQTRGERVTPRVDVYGFGVLVWSLLAGRKPPTDGSRLESVSAIRNDVPREIAAAIDAALEPAADKRKITCLEIQQWLEKVTNVESGKGELHEKILLLRAARGPVGETASAAGPAARAAKKPRRRLSLRQVHASQRPPGPGPLSVPPPPSTRPSLRPAGMPSQRPDHGPKTSRPASTRIDPRAEPDAEPPPSRGPLSLRQPVEQQAWRASLPESANLDSMLEESLGNRAAASTRSPAPGATSDAPPMATRAIPPPAPGRPAYRTMIGGMSASAALPLDANAGDPQGAPAILEPEPPRSVAPPNGEAPPLAADDRGLVDVMGAQPLGWRDIGEEPSAGAPVVMERGTAARGRAAPAETPAAAGRKPLSALQSIGVAAATAGLVVVAGMLIADRDGKPPAASAAPPRVDQVIQPTARPAPSTAALGPTATAQEGAPAVAPTGGASAPGDFPAGYGGLTVRFPGRAAVFLNGTAAGFTNEPLQVICGSWHVRIGQADENGKVLSWLSRARTGVTVPCLSTATVDFIPGQEAGPKPRYR